MKDFNELCREYETLDAESYAAILTEKAANVLPALHAVTESGIDGATIFLSYILAAIAADGRLSEEEYALIYPLLYAFFGEGVDYEACKEAVRKTRRFGGKMKKIVKSMTDVFGVVSDGLKDDIVLICLMICAVDGKVSPKEKRWIRKLIA